MSSLEAGLAALKRKNYAVAIKQLEASCAASSQSHQSSYYRAQMGLMQAYAATHHYHKSLTACQNLLLSSSAKVQQWAAQHSFSIIKIALKEADTDKDEILAQLRQLIAQHNYQLLHDSISTITQEFLEPELIAEEPAIASPDSNLGQIANIKPRVTQKSLPKMQVHHKRIRADQNLKKKKKRIKLVGQRVLIGFGALLLLWVTVGNLVADYYVAQVKREIEEEWSDVLKSDYNETAYRLQEIGTKNFGLKLIEWNHEEAHPIDIDVNVIEKQRLNELTSTINTYLERQYKVNSNDIELPPKKLQIYTEDKEKVFDEIHEILKEEIPTFEKRLSFYYNSDSPNAGMGVELLELQKILVANIFINQINRKQQKVERDLETLWTLNQSTNNPRSLIEILINDQSTRYLLIVLNKIQKLPPVWISRLKKLNEPQKQIDNSFYSGAGENIFAFHVVKSMRAKDIREEFLVHLKDAQIEDQEEENAFSVFMAPIFYLLDIVLAPLIKFSAVESYETKKQALNYLHEEFFDFCEIHLFLRENKLKNSRWNIMSYYPVSDSFILKYNFKIALVYSMRVTRAQELILDTSLDRYDPIIYTFVDNITNEQIKLFCS
ncbi:MAG: hypothetical protein F6J87_13005 [Spirulina sp. SIO3F2]|nr:hypothetical protein [Spirulina sp. SIO3F2]